MAKGPNLTQFPSNTLNVAKLNEAFAKINTAFENTISRDGSTPNSMSSDIDLNSNDILNVKNIVADEITVNGNTLSGSVLAAANSASAALASETAAALSAAQAALFDNIFIDDVSTLLADTTLSYSAGPGTQVSVGDYIQTRAEGFLYQVASSVVSDQHLTSAGGVKFYILPVSGGVYDIAATGAPTDGTGDAGPYIAKIINTLPTANSRAVISSSSGSSLRVSTQITIDRPVIFHGISILAGGNNVIFQVDSDNVRFDNCTFDLTPASSATSMAINATGRDRIEIEYCQFINGYYGAFLTECSNTRFYNNTGSGSQHWHIYINGGENILISKNTMSDGVYDGIKLAGNQAAGSGTTSIKSAIISDNICFGFTRDGIDCAMNNCDGLLITGNSLYNNKLQAIEVKTVSHADSPTFSVKRVVISNNVCISGPFTNSGTNLISCQSEENQTSTPRPFEDVVISGNRCHLNSGVLQLRAIRCSNVLRSRIYENHITTETTTEVIGLVRIHFGLSTIIERNHIEALGGVAAACVYVSSLTTADPTSGVVIRNNYLVSGTGRNTINLVDAAVTGTQIYNNEIRPDSGQYALAISSAVNTTYRNNRRGSTSGNPALRGYPGDYFDETAQDVGRPERWICVAQGSSGSNLWRGQNQRGFREISGSPVGVTTPYYAGEELYDTVGTNFWKSHGTGNTNWEQIS